MYNNLVFSGSQRFGGCLQGLKIPYPLWCAGFIMSLGSELSSSLFYWRV